MAKNLLEREQESGRLDRVRCPKCGAEHDFGDMEPSFAFPDAYVEVPETERDFRTIVGPEDCRIRDLDDTNHRYFLRVVMPVPVRGKASPCRWGVWVEVECEAFERTRELWDSPNQAGEPPFEGTLANRVPAYPTTLGLQGTVQLSGPTTRPSFTLLRNLDHPLASEQRLGVSTERVTQWLIDQLHT